MHSLQCILLYFFWLFLISFPSELNQIDRYMFLNLLADLNHIDNVFTGIRTWLAMADLVFLFFIFGTNNVFRLHAFHFQLTFCSQLSYLTKLSPLLGSIMLTLSIINLNRIRAKNCGRWWQLWDIIDIWFQCGSHQKFYCNSIFKFETEVNMKTEQQISYAKT